MSDEEVASLAEDIKTHGQINPIWIYEGMILDGRNRHRACVLAGIAPRFTDYKGDKPVAFTWSCNSERKHYSTGQRAAMAAEIMPGIQEEARKRQVRKPTDSVMEKVPEQKREVSRAEAAKITGTNPKYVDAAVKIKEQSPETFTKLKAGTITMQDAKREVARKPSGEWKKDERDRQKLVMAGKSVVANYERDKNLIAWAEEKKCAMPVDRGSRFGNPFILGGDGDRDEVCEKYETHYLPYKTSLMRRPEDVRGKVLCCHCYPERCHAESLIKILCEE